MKELDLAVFRGINGWPESLSGFLRFFSEATNYLWFKVLLAVLVAFLIWRGREYRKAGVCALLAFPIANGFTDILKAFFPQNRPFQDHLDIVLRAGWSASHGTASAHSANMAAVAVVFVVCRRWWGLPWVVIALVTGISRVYVGVHYPHQVVFGWICGVLAGYLVLWAWGCIAARVNRVSKADLEPSST